MSNEIRKRSVKLKSNIVKIAETIINYFSLEYSIKNFSMFKRNESALK